MVNGSVDLRCYWEPRLAACRAFLDVARPAARLLLAGGDVISGDVTSSRQPATPSAAAAAAAADGAARRPVQNAAATLHYFGNESAPIQLAIHSRASSPRGPFPMLKY